MQNDHYSENLNELASKYSQQDQKTQKEIEEKIYNLLSPIVNSIVNRYVRYNSRQRQDLVMEGFLAGIEALRQFDASYGVKFSTYAFSFISKRISNTLQDMNISGQAKQYKKRELSLYRKEKKQLESELRREPSVNEIAIRLGKKISTVLQYERLLNKPISFEDLTLKSDDDDNEVKFEDTIVDTSETEWQESIKNYEFCEDFDKFLISIPELDAIIIRMAVGYNSTKYSYDEISKKLGISKSAAYRKFQSYLPQMEKLLH